MEMCNLNLYDVVVELANGISDTLAVMAKTEAEAIQEAKDRTYLLLSASHIDTRIQAMRIINKQSI